MYSRLLVVVLLSVSVPAFGHESSYFGYLVRDAEPRCSKSWCERTGKESKGEVCGCPTNHDHEHKYPHKRHYDK